MADFFCLRSQMTSESECLNGTKALSDGVARLRLLRLLRFSRSLMIRAIIIAAIIKADPIPITDPNIY